MTDPCGNPLTLRRPNVVVVGTGAIGTALANTLVKNSHGGKVLLLGRREPEGLLPAVELGKIDAIDTRGIRQTAAEISDKLGVIHLLINTVGVLHGSGLQPEKRLSELTPEALQQAMAVNALFLPQLAQGFSGALRHGEPAILASLSARVGSIADNDLGGWYSYRASKAAHNMLLRTLSREWRVSHRNLAIVALHPGTVASPLSAPFVSSRYRNRVLAPDECATHLLEVLGKLSPQDTGSFYDWRGERIPW
jgi:NAD(P)-dependent dehydrogenase (short-subunit alcohol dehydrogenase family)